MIIRPDPSIGVMFSCADNLGGNLTLQAQTLVGRGDVLGLVVSSPDGTAVVALDSTDQLALARTLRVLRRAAAGPETAPTSEVEKMVALAEELENFGYKGAFLSDEVIRFTLAANSTVEAMLAYVEDAYQNSQKRQEEETQ